MRSLVDQLFRQRKNVIVFLALHQLSEMLDPRGRIHFLGDDQGFGLEIERNAGISARCRARALHITFRRFHGGNGVHHRFQVLGRGPAAPSHDAHAIILHEVLVIISQFRWR